jgi:intraflagellar transport protein 56
MYGQKKDSRDYLKAAQQLFQMVGASVNECDTIPGRQCMASCFFLLKQFDDVLVYLNSIKSYFETDDDFHWNYAIACASSGDYKEAEKSFLAIRNERYKSEECYIKWLIRTYIMNGKPKNAWDIYLSTETSSDCFNVLQIIGNDCYKMGHFYYSSKAFEALEKIDSDRDYEDALRGSVIGIFQMTIAGK